MRMSDISSGHFVLGREVLCEFDSSIPPTKVCPQCKAAVPVKRKTCERCGLVFRKAECNLKQFNYETYGSSRIRQCETR